MTKAPRERVRLRAQYLVLAAGLLAGGLAIWRPSLRDIGIGLVVLALVWIAGVGRLGIAFVRPRPEAKREPPGED